MKLLAAAQKYEGRNSDSEKIYVDTARYLAIRAKYVTGNIRVDGFYSSIYEDEGKYDISLKYALEAMRMAEKKGVKKLIAKSANNVAIVYYDLKAYDTALNYFNMELNQYSEIHDTIGTIKVLNNMGAAYINEKNYEEGMKCYQKGLAMSLALHDSNLLSAFYTNIGRIYTERKEYEQGLFYGLEAYRIAASRKDYYTLASVATNIGFIYKEQKNYDSALKYFQKTDSIAAFQQNDNLLLLAFQNICSTFYRKKSIDSAYRYLCLYDSLQQKVYNAESSKQIADMQTKYNTQKKEQAIILLTTERKHQQAVIYFIFALSALLLAFIWFIYRSYRQKKKINIELDVKNRKLSEANAVIAEKNKDITDSINYAKLIQNARLPDKAIITKHLPNHFILYKPKDIVSGDFYFFHKKETAIDLAAADCTGHVVPGAMMSMIGSEKLEYAVHNASEPAKILGILNTEIRDALKQSEIPNTSHDGMDVALCRIDTSNGIVHFSGANRPLWITKNLQKGVINEIKPDKLSIGGFTPADQQFGQHEVKPDPGDTFYIFSDGFADTFNGKSGKKLTTKRFRNLILSMQDVPFNEQEHFLDNFIEDWKAGAEQTDDILVIGVRV
ncbi:MAG: SpoIIE family protein phosphatase [Bacteroidia bacterium]|nr:SpoIIE family protein phosphatase [Bacteroidia bacterium]